LPLVGVVMGSASDEPVVQETVKVLEQLEIDYEVRVMSAHRTPERVQEYATTARDRGIEVLISAAGGSAALGGRSGVLDNHPGYRHPACFQRIKGNGRSASHRPDAAGNTGGLHGRGSLGSP